MCILNYMNAADQGYVQMYFAKNRPEVSFALYNIISTCTTHATSTSSSLGFGRLIEPVLVRRLNHVTDIRNKFFAFG